ESIAEYQRRVENAPRREQEFQALSRDYETTKDSYRSLLKRYKEAQLAESLEERQKGEQFRILDPAMLPERPTAPNRPRMIVMALLLALAVAAGAALAAERFDSSFHTVEDLRGFSKIPVLVSIPRIVIASDTRRERLRFWVKTVTAVASLVLIAGGSYLLAHGNDRLAHLLVGTPFSGN
ncbi:MAG: protein tyrosine kinase modulator, partial [Candidatus Binatota bacterium]|nr:protein tyrosine kinase modulator [Candidatus Binatota bacterium]